MLVGGPQMAGGRAWLADGFVYDRKMLTDGISWLVAVPCLDDAGTGEPRQVDVFS